MSDGDAVLHFNFRPDRARQLVMALGEPDFEEFDRSGAPRVELSTMTQYRAEWAYPIAFAPVEPETTLAEVIAEAGLRQLHVAETEKYAHVTYFFNGGREREWEGEERRLVPSPRDVATYDEKPQMSAREAADAFTDNWKGGEFSFGIINFANPDMVGHTGDIPAAVKAIEAVDECLAQVVAAVADSGGACIVTADHGNADNMLEPDGSPNTAHSLNPVPFVVTDRGDRPVRWRHPRRRRADRPRPARNRATGRDDRPLAARLMRADPDRLEFEIEARDGAARAGHLLTAHGPVATPAFVPLATKATVRSLSGAEVAGLGYEMVLGNTYHLMLSPGAERIEALGGLHRFMGWERPIITDSGGFQVFSLAHGGVADEIKGRRGAKPAAGAGDAAGHGSVLEISEEGVRFRSHIDGSEWFMGPEESMQVQAALGSDIALVFDECTPFHADRDYTARSTERTHRWLDRCLEWHNANGPERQAVFGIVQGGIYEDLRERSAERVAAAGVDGIAIGGTLGRDKPEMYGVLDLTLPHLPTDAPKHLLGIGEPDDLLEGIARGIDSFDCAVPTRLARHGMALGPHPDSRYRFNVRHAGLERDEGPLVEGCPCDTCASHTRAYVHYLARSEELTGVRLLTHHNLAYTEAIVAGAREAIAAARFDTYRSAVLAGSAPWAA